jgi:hypothetical protein
MSCHSLREVGRVYSYYVGFNFTISSLFIIACVVNKVVGAKTRR